MATLSVGEKTKSSTAVRVIYAMLSYALGLWMLLYGMSKITALQFQVFPSTYVKPLAEVRGFFAIATFFGRFHWLAVLLGFVESIPSILLLFSVLTVVTGMLIVDVGLLLLDQKTRKRIRELFFLNSAPEFRRWQLELAFNCILVFCGSNSPFMPRIVWDLLSS